MRYPKRVLFGFVFAVLYAAVFVRFPKLNLETSTYATLCTTPEANLGSKFSIVDSFPGSYVRITSLNKAHPRASGFAYKDDDGDVAAKVLCANFPNKVDHALDYVRSLPRTTFDGVRYSSSNYTIILFKPAFTPSWASFVFEIFGGAAILGFFLLVFSNGKPKR